MQHNTQTGGPDAQVMLRTGLVVVGLDFKVKEHQPTPCHTAVGLELGEPHGSLCVEGWDVPYGHIPVATRK